MLPENVYCFHSVYHDLDSGICIWMVIIIAVSNLKVVIKYLMKTTTKCIVIRMWTKTKLLKETYGWDYL